MPRGCRDSGVAEGSVAEVSLAGQAPYRRIALLVVALVAAAALVVVPLVVRAARSAPATCLGPADAGTVSLGRGIDAGVIALTAMSGRAAQTPVSVRMVNAPRAAMASQTLWIFGPGAPGIALDRRTTGCWGADVPRSALADASVRASSSADAPTLGRFSLPADPQSGASLLALAHRATLGLAGLREYTLGRKSVVATPQPVQTLFEGAMVVSRSAAGVLRFSWPGWRSGFEWMTPGIQASVVLGATTVGGVPAVRVAGAVAQTPLWMELDIDPSTGMVVADSMNGPNHVMTNRYAPVVR
jgi:hypothetical protein